MPAIVVLILSDFYTGLKPSAIYDHDLVSTAEERSSVLWMSSIVQDCIFPPIVVIFVVKL